MVYYIRNDKNKSIAEIEVWQDSEKFVNIKSFVYLEEYNKCIINLMKELRGGEEIKKFMNDFYLIFCCNNKYSNKQSSYELAQQDVYNFLKNIANKYNFKIIED